MRTIRTTVLLIGVAMLAACGTDADTGSDTTMPPPTSPTSTTSTTAGETTTVPSPTDDVPIDAAIALLAEELGIPVDEITVVLAEPVLWNDGSLGCPEPGMSYTQALVPGYRVLLEADGDTYAVHGADGREPFVCDENLAEGEPRERP